MDKRIMKLDLQLQSLREAFQNASMTPRKLILSLRQQALENNGFNAWIHLLEEQELEPYLLELEQSDINSLPLFGVPFAIKDNIDLAGIPTTAACPDFSYVPDKHAFAVDCLVKAGAIPLGKTNMDQFATGLVGTRSPYGQGKNVFNPAYISGGSSSGSAIATALGLVSFALGTDTAGSGRVPAVLNNLIGFKPSLGLISNSGVVPACRSLDSVSIFALNAVDAGTIADCVCRYDEEEPWSRITEFPNHSRFVTEALPEDFTFGVADVTGFEGGGECERLYQQAVEQLELLGGTSVKVDFSPFVEAARLLYQGPWIAERQLATRDVKPESMLDVIRAIICEAEPAQAKDLFSAQYRLRELKRICDRAVDSVDLIIMPTTPTVPLRSEVDAEPVALNSMLGRFTNFVNLLDYCAVAVPTGALSSGPHWGITLFSAAQSDMRLLSYAHALQKAQGLPVGATGNRIKAAISVSLPMPEERVEVVVCGAHLKGQPLNWQLTERCGILKSSCLSARAYRLFVLSDGRRPAMIRDDKNGHAVEVEVWSLPVKYFGGFVAAIPAPLGIGKVELEDGSWKTGFICEYSGLLGATDITGYGGWRKWLNKQVVI